ncbi:CBS domain-containing protein [Streptomyces sp. NPDC089795]|uniref:CBS domain-containing protein n=1 Tax=Streptomyces sp. NPDC089795 TaxID=3155297 RepID=UPI00342E93D5
MTPEPGCIDAESTVLAAAQKLARLDVSALPICGTDHRLKGMLTHGDSCQAMTRSRRLARCTVERTFRSMISNSSSRSMSRNAPP